MCTLIYKMLIYRVDFQTVHPEVNSLSESVPFTVTCVLSSEVCSVL